MAKKSRFCKDRLSYYIVNDKRTPFLVRQAFAKADFCACPEQELWREVLARHVLDAIGSTGLQKPEEHNVALSTARVWFRACQDSVQDVIDLSGIEAKAANFAEAMLAIKPPATAWKEVKEVDYCEKPEKGVRSRRAKKEAADDEGIQG